VPEPIDHDIGSIINSLAYEDAEALANDLLKDSDMICQKNVRELQAKLQAEYEQLLREEIKKSPELTEEEAQAEAEWRLRHTLRMLRDRLLAYGAQQEELRRQRDANILAWVKKQMV